MISWIMKRFDVHESIRRVFSRSGWKVMYNRKSTTYWHPSAISFEVVSTEDDAVIVDVTIHKGAVSWGEQDNTCHMRMSFHPDVIATIASRAEMADKKHFDKSKLWKKVLSQHPFLIHNAEKHCSEDKWWSRRIFPSEAYVIHKVGSKFTIRCKDKEQWKAVHADMTSGEYSPSKRAYLEQEEELAQMIRELSQAKWDLAFCENKLASRKKELARIDEQIKHTLKVARERGITVSPARDEPVMTQSRNFSVE